MLTALLLVFMLNDKPLDFTEAQQVPDVDVMALSDEMKAFLDEHVSMDNPLHRFQKLVYVVFNDEFLNLTYDNSRTKTAAETFQDRNGNCLSFTNMFVAMARYVDLESRFQEVNIVPTWDRNGRVVMLNRHINAVVQIFGRKYVVDFNPNAERINAKTWVVADSRALAQYYNNVGAEYFSHGATDKARAYFMKAVQTDPQVPFIWSNLGVSYSLSKMEAEAEYAYLKALDLNGDEYTAMHNLAKLYSRTERFSDAARYERRVQAYRERNPYYHFNQGEEAYTVGNYDEALKHYRRALRRKPKEHDFLFGLAKAYARLGDHNHAEEYLKKAAEFAPDRYNKHRYNQKLQLLTASAH